MQQQPELPYIPLVFIKTGVIGGSKSNKNTIQNQYDYTYHDLLKPHLLQNHNAVFYILFHSASIYNWLRTVPSKESQLLHKYITSDRVEKSFNSVNNTNQIVSSLQDYVSRWQVVKLAFASTVYVSKVREVGSQACQHLAKTQQNTVQLYFDAKNKNMNCNKVKCKECSRLVQIEGELRNISDSFISRHVEYSLPIKQRRYESYILFSRHSVYVKAANLIWHQINLQTAQTRVVGTQSINLKEIQLAVYHTPKHVTTALFQAQPIQYYLTQNLQKDRKMKGKNKLLDSQNNQNIVQQQFQQKEIKNQKKQIKTSSGNNLFKVEENNQKISQLKFTPNRVVLKQDQFNEEYVRQVQQHYIQPKIKDEYELDYDKGKLKKIRQKIHYIQPDYNQIYRQVKRQQARPRYQHSKKIRKDRHDRGDRFDRNDRSDKRKDSYDDY